MRILPVTIASLSLLLMAKVYDIYETGNRFSRIFLGGTAQAQAEEAAPTETAAADAETDVGEASEAESTTADNDAASDETQMAAVDATPDETTALSDDDMVDAQDKREFSEIELDILQSLSKRREALDALEEEVRLKESLLESTELRLDQKIEQIKQLDATVRELLREYDEEEEAKIRSLVKIYENMKPKEAARIFDELDMPILLLVVDRMSERRAAPILAKMSPLKAKFLTQELAEDRKLRTQQETELNNLTGQ